MIIVPKTHVQKKADNKKGCSHNQSGALGEIITPRLASY
jgi:hypothetical protein